MKEIESRENFDPVDLIKSINPDMAAEQAVAQIEEFNRIELNRTKAPVVEARNELLRKAGYDPKDWIYYSNTLRLGDQSNEDMMRSLARPFPEEVEFLIVQGDFIGGVGGIPGVTSTWSVVRYKYNPDGFTAFIRVRPKQIEGGK